MYFRPASTDAPDGELLTEMNAGGSEPFGCINFGRDGGYIAVKNDADAERLIRAAHRIIAMRHMLGKPHAFAPGDATAGVDKHDCIHCGMNATWADHAEPAPPVITDSERTCPEQNPETGAWCHQDGKHAEHLDTDGETWRTDLEVAGSIGRTRLAVCGRHAAMDAAGRCDHCDDGKPEDGPGGVPFGRPALAAVPQAADQ
jgi:hypothetical protein